MQADKRAEIIKHMCNNQMGLRASTCCICCPFWNRAVHFDVPKRQSDRNFETIVTGVSLQSCIRLNTDALFSRFRTLFSSLDSAGLPSRTRYSPQKSCWCQRCRSAAACTATAFAASTVKGIAFPSVYSPQKHAREDDYW